MVFGQVDVFRLFPQATAVQAIPGDRNDGRVIGGALFGDLVEGNRVGPIFLQIREVRVGDAWGIDHRRETTRTGVLLLQRSLVLFTFYVWVKVVSHLVFVCYRHNDCATVFTDLHAVGGELWDVFLRGRIEFRSRRSHFNNGNLLLYRLRRRRVVKEEVEDSLKRVSRFGSRLGKYLLRLFHVFVNTRIVMGDMVGEGNRV